MSAEFELVADLMLAHMGWGRISMLGGSMPDVDLVVAQAPNSLTSLRPTGEHQGNACVCMSLEGGEHGS